jgi:uncharacterized protein
MLPEFRYHPHPIATGSVKPSDKACRCCDQSRGFVYSASVYAVEELNEAICPFCIADGSASKKFDAMFVDSHPLLPGISKQIVEEVTRRTPGYVSWQQEVWLACCDDACEFHGDVPRNELRALDEEALREVLSDLQLTSSELRVFVKLYVPGGDPAVYKFVCRHCRRIRYGIDCS